MKLSVIVPAFNVEDYIGECLDSIIDQSLKDIEIIVVDDGSTDDTSEIIKRYKKKDNRVKYIYQENKKIGAARNKGWEVASGEYIYFIDSDDFIHPEWLQMLYRNAKENDLDIICGDRIEFLEKKLSYRVIKDKNIDYCFYNLKIFKPEVFTNHQNIYEVMVWKYMYKKEFLDNLGFKFYEKYWYEDCEFSHKVVFSTDKIGYIDIKLLYHRKWRGSFAQKKIDKELLFSSIKLIESLNKFYNESLDEKYKEHFSKLIALEMIRPISHRSNFKEIEEYKDIDTKFKNMIFHFKDSSKKKHKLLYVFLTISLPITSKLLSIRYKYHERKRIL